MTAPPLSLALQDREGRPVLLLLGPRASSEGRIIADTWYAYRKAGRGTHVEGAGWKLRLLDATTQGLHSGPLWRATGVQVPDERLALEVRE